MADDLAALAPKALRTLLDETMFGAKPNWSFVINAGEPGLIATLKGLTAAQASQQPGAGRKPIVSHANHVLYGYELINRAVAGDAKAFTEADWTVAWKLEHVTDAEWSTLLERLETQGRKILALAETIPSGIDEIMLTGLFGSAAHNAYHLGAIRQILRDLENPA
ncbi:MAG: hypothetical protein J0M17_23775 [Planctomycetes bacterium]|nr:hypothetical protein [Planctomycetota bacterium]